MKFQSKTKIGIFIGAVVILLVIGVLFFCIAKPSTSDEIKTSYLRGTFSIDYSDLNAVVGDADYVFVGTVASEEGTVYKDAVTVETDDGKTREVSGPYTNYTVNVTKNIKCNLVTTRLSRFKNLADFRKMAHNILFMRVMSFRL